jgi:hypothetical protein
MAIALAAVLETVTGDESRIPLAYELPLFSGRRARDPYTRTECAFAAAELRMS